MSRGLLFWILVILWVIFGFFGAAIVDARHVVYVGWGSNLLLLILFALLGWQVFGPPIKG
jgi:hypothetical protein